MMDDRREMLFEPGDEEYEKRQIATHTLGDTVQSGNISGKTDISKVSVGSGDTVHIYKQRWWANAEARLEVVASINGDAVIDADYLNSGGRVSEFGGHETPLLTHTFSDTGSLVYRIAPDEGASSLDDVGVSFGGRARTAVDPGRL